MKQKTDNKHGGRRAGAGRPKGTGRFKEPSKAIRVPEGSIAHIKQFIEGPYLQMSDQLAAQNNELDTPSLLTKPNSGDFDQLENIAVLEPHKLAIPLYSSRVAAGYPTPAEDHIDETLDLNDYMVHRPDTTFMLRVEGESMKDIGILPNDILVVDRSLTATHNKIVIAALDGELTVKRLFNRGGLIKLLPENPAYPEIEIQGEADLHIWGVVIGSFRRFQSF